MPTVTVVTDVFAGLGREVAAALGAPDTPMSVIPHPLGGLSQAEAEARGRDALRDVLNRLHQQPAPATFAKPVTPAAVKLHGSWEAVNDAFYQQGWTDGLPIVPPWRDKVEAMIAASGKPAQLLVAVVPPRMGMATVETIAVNAVMAGCEPRYMPVVVAAVGAMCRPEFNLLPMQDRKSTRLNSSHVSESRMPSSA